MMKSNYILMFSIIFSSLFLNLNACGRLVDAASTSDENKCGYKYISGRQCIICSKGGVSCQWD